MTDQNNGLEFANDLFSFAGMAAPEVKQPEPQISRKRTPPVRRAPSPNSGSGTGSRITSQKSSKALEVNAETVFSYLNQIVPLTDFFTVEELQRGLPNDRPVQVITQQENDRVEDEEEEIDEEDDNGLDLQNPEPSESQTDEAANIEATTPEFRPIEFEDIRKRLKENGYREMHQHLTFYEFIKEENMIIIGINFKSKGNQMMIKGTTGVYASLDVAQNNPKPIMYVPTHEGWYLLRDTAVMTVTNGPVVLPDYLGSVEIDINQDNLVTSLPKGVEMKISKLLWSDIARFIEDARFYSLRFGTELHCDIFYDPEEDDYLYVIPDQTVSAARVDSNNKSLPSRHLIKVLEIHSHHIMSARPSKMDDENEVAPILYAIIGKVHNFFPELTVRTCIDGQHLSIDPEQVITSPFAEDVFPTLIRRTEPYPQVQVRGGRRW